VLARPTVGGHRPALTAPIDPDEIGLLLQEPVEIGLLVLHEPVEIGLLVLHEPD
jgi:hypothetical protein